MGSTSTTTQNAQPWAPTRQPLVGGIQDATKLYNQGGFEVNPYGGPMVAGYDPMRAQADAATGGAVDAAIGMAGQGNTALTRAMDPSIRSAGWDQVVNNTVARIMPGINSSFAGSGMTGSGLHAQNLSAGLASGIADIENQAWQQGEARALQAAGMVPGMNAASLAPLDYLRSAGQDRQGYQQDVINADILKNQQQQSVQKNALQDYLSLVAGIGSPFGISSSSTSQSPGLMGILGMGLQAAPLMFSDRRLKEDIKRVGETDDGENVYTYRYKGSPTVHMGVMAQEVARTKPEAVHNVGGLLAVDYGAL